MVGVDAGRQGKVKELIKDRNLLVVEGIRMFSRKMPKMPLVKPEEQGQLINEERALRYEEVMLVDPQVKWVPTDVFKMACS